ncbi:cupin domain-containing protein [Sphingobium subterraneum]|uniref:Putative cupin superfamily protein n=1 Tax=Sphingobium subterraneum TaxID=627688 RepID=A0A841J842_9SPHN|nr:cupin domain-containing protein [Sphingobium subterraneum]MBB6124341.1 putative cupin superfamily protein [Sphingobium subterraneum]
MPKIDLSAIPQTNTTGYPAPYAQTVAGRHVRRLASATGLSDFGVSQVVLKPGAWSSQRHWHEGEDEFLVLVAGAAVLVDDGGRMPLVPGDCAAFPKGDGNGHHVVNESDGDAVFVVVGAITNGTAHYPDINMIYDGGTGRYLRGDRTESA